MSTNPQSLSLSDWDERYQELVAGGMSEPDYGGPLRRHFTEGHDWRLGSLRFDNSAAALRLWNFLLTEEDRLQAAREQGKRLVGAMKDLGTIPVMAYASPRLVAFYPDGAWWTPCLMQLSDGLFQVADSMGIDESFCPVRAMLGAFVTRAHFPIPDLLTCSVGATCDDFSAIAQRLEALGHPILWWEIPPRRSPEPEEASVRLPGSFCAPVAQVDLVRHELERVRRALESLAETPLEDAALWASIRAANQVRRVLARLREAVYAARACPLPALEMLVAEMLALHYCSDRSETLAVLQALLAEVESRIQSGQGLLAPEAVRVFWVNPVADLQVMNLLESCGGRVCGTEYLFCHALDEIPEDLPPLEALARMALADPMVGSVADRARRIGADLQRLGAEALVISRIPGASHCAWEGRLMGDWIRQHAPVPVLEIEVPPVSDACSPSLRTRLEALVETVLARRQG